MSAPNSLLRLMATQRILRARQQDLTLFDVVFSRGHPWLFGCLFQQVGLGSASLSFILKTTLSCQHGRSHPGGRRGGRKVVRVTEESDPWMGALGGRHDGSHPSSAAGEWATRDSCNGNTADQGEHSLVADKGEHVGVTQGRQRINTRRRYMEIFFLILNHASVPACVC